jgi:hypothetical protein
MQIKVLGNKKYRPNLWSGWTYKDKILTIGLFIIYIRIELK